MQGNTDTSSNSSTTPGDQDSEQNCCMATLDWEFGQHSGIGRLARLEIGVRVAKDGRCAALKTPSAPHGPSIYRPAWQLQPCRTCCSCFTLQVCLGCVCAASFGTSVSISSPSAASDLMFLAAEISTVVISTSLRMVSKAQQYVYAKACLQ